MCLDHLDLKAATHVDVSEPLPSKPTRAVAAADTDPITTHKAQPTEARQAAAEAAAAGVDTRMAPRFAVGARGDLCTSGAAEGRLREAEEQRERGRLMAARRDAPRSGVCASRRVPQGHGGCGGYQHCRHG